tara:strand:+ start:525 stop:803 length:279 start_codon:yes stop_codon:yes gene_type:complete
MKLTEQKLRKIIREELNEASAPVRGLNELETSYYNISDEMGDIERYIKAILMTPAGEQWEAEKMEKGALAKELGIFRGIKKLFAKSKLGKVL